MSNSLLIVRVLNVLISHSGLLRLVSDRGLIKEIIIVSVRSKLKIKDLLSSSCRSLPT